MSRAQLPISPKEAPSDGTKTHRLPLVETFGPTLQGEGPAAGRLSTFVRFGGCNLSCSWCDSAYTWDADRFDLRAEITLATAPEILAAVPSAPIYVITGGEPLLNQRNPAWPEFLDGLKARGGELHVETNGTIVPNDVTLQYVDKFIVSPKLGHAGEHKRTQSPALNPGWTALHEVPAFEAHLKIVVQTPEDVATAATLAEDNHWPKEQVWVMPEGTTTAVLNDRFPMVATEATRHGINASHRLHVLAWTDVRGH